MFKRILQVGLPVAFIVCCIIGSYNYIDKSGVSVYSFTIKAKWQSASIGKHSVSEYNKFEMCLVDKPNVCITEDVRQDTYNKYSVGSVVAFKYAKGEVYGYGWFTGLFTFLSVLSVGLILAFGVVYLFDWLYGGGEKDLGRDYL
jgi:hypothetical protein